MGSSCGKYTQEELNKINEWDKKEARYYNLKYKKS